MEVEKEMVGRARERTMLTEAMTSKVPEFVAVFGRRRVGKTFLIRQVCGPYFDFELTGLHEGTMAQQLQNFVYAFRTQFPDFEPDRNPGSWLEAFFLLSEALASLPKKKKTVIFLDELPWLATRRSGFLTGLSWFWNSWASTRRVTIIVCGSAASWMIANVIRNRGGLHNRVTRMIHLHPFNLKETEEYLRTKRIKLNRYNIVQLYMSLGGIPMYLDQVRPGLTASQNIHEICFRKDGYLRMEFDRLFASLFERPDNQIEIIRAVAQKKMGITRQEIIDMTSFRNGGMLTKLIRELVESGFMQIYSGFGKKTRLSLYRLTDPYSFFYLTFMERLGPNSHVDFTKLSELPQYRTWSGYAFENLCMNHIDQIRKALGISGMYTQASSFYAKGSPNTMGAQIDLLFDRQDKAINLCEIKYSDHEYSFSRKDAEAVQLKKYVFREKTRCNKHIFTSLITTIGAVENENKLNFVDQVVTMDDLFASV
jgi:AAA+ ATPase superfamily predicted ATPase